MYLLMGSAGLFQKTMFALSMFTLFCSACPINLLSYSAPEPITECLNNDGVFETCTEKAACSLLESGHGRVYFDRPNWTQEFDMICEKEDQRKFIKSLYVFGGLVTTIIGLMLTDYLGRKASFYITFLMTIAGCFGLIIGSDFMVKVVSASVASCGSSIYGSLFTIALSEWIRKLSIKHS